MDLIVKFTLPGLATALVFYVAIMCCPFKYWLLKFHWVIDICFTGMMLVIFAGTYSGAMTAALGGIILTGLLWSTWYFFYEPIPIRSTNYGHEPKIEGGGGHLRAAQNRARQKA